MHSILAIAEFKIPNSGLMNCIGLLLQKKIVLLKQLHNLLQEQKGNAIDNRKLLFRDH